MSPLWTKPASLYLAPSCMALRSPAASRGGAPCQSRMDELRIERAVCCHLGMLQHAWEVGYEESLQAYRESQGRIVCYAAFDPGDRHG